MQFFAVALACLTFLLLILGGVVHNTGSSLACPDWPLCNGTAFPRMVGGVLVEHSHRLVAGTVVVLAAVLLLLVLTLRRDRLLHALAGAAFGCVIVQAGLGAITVKFRLPPLVSTAHLGTSMIFFALVITLYFRLRPTSGAALPPKVARMAAWAAGLVYVQMVLGAAVRHLGAGLACTDLPLCRGAVFPLGVDFTVQLHALHRLFALLVLGHIVGTAAAAYRAGADRPGVRALALAAPLLALVQITLGVLTIVSFRDIIPLTAHLAVAAALLGDLVALYWTARGLSAAPEPETALAVTA